LKCEKAVIEKGLLGSAALEADQQTAPDRRGIE
jgi:hypothetical protein